MPPKDPNDRHEERKLRHLFAELATPHAVRKQRAGERRLARAARRDDPDLPPPEVVDEEAWLDSEAPAHPVRRTAIRGLPARPPSAADPSPQLATAEGLVVGTGQGWARVRVGEVTHQCRLAPDLERRGMPRPVVGDVATITGSIAGGEALRLVAVAPRRGVLARPDPAGTGRELVLAANVDIVVLVLALGPPGLRAGLADRVRLAADRGGADLVVAVNKIDLAVAAAAAPAGDADGRAAALLPLAPLAASGVVIVPCSAASGEGLDRLAAALVGRTAVFVGPSGVGKSSLLNRLTGAAVATGAVREVDGKGRHTTTTSALVALPGGGALVDTPGIRQFGLARPSRDELATAFPDVAAVSIGCRFRDCGHDAEPGCAVATAVADGTLAAVRLAAWRRLTVEEES